MRAPDGDGPRCGREPRDDASRVGRMRLGNTGGRPACCRAATVNGELSVLSYLMEDASVLVPPLVDLTVTDGDEPTPLVTRSFQAPSASTAWGCPIWVPAAL